MTLTTIAQGNQPKGDSVMGHPQHQEVTNWTFFLKRHEIVVLLPKPRAVGSLSVKNDYSIVEQLQQLVFTKFLLK